MSETREVYRAGPSQPETVTIQELNFPDGSRLRILIDAPAGQDLSQAHEAYQTRLKTNIEETGQETNILDHPDLKDLNPESEREGLLFLKAYFTGIDAALKAIKAFGLESVEALHRKVMGYLVEKVKGQ